MTVRKIGFLADTHSNRPDGSDLPDAVLKAFKGVDLIVHLGDVGRKGILDRLGEVAQVWVPYGDDKGYVPHLAREAEPVKVLDGRLGLTFNLTKPDKKIAVGQGAPTTIAYVDGALPALLQRRFKADVAVVAFGGTHVAHAEERDGVLFVNPGSPTLPSDGPTGSVAVLDLSTKKPKATLIRLP
ncbi:MAG TPA: metallophosphoesterase family protein [Acidimicrobiales bacterium]|nr:metallophosphoesterase family protein [Acidimicrobiales bacterium]